ncbi:Zn-ribbon domain-containing OB-fold protein [Piscinibacter sakaiensis]|uniref:Zn-ribbon domain-containing OB-fold protein n=1 Tax=Piscinibacter sakaiensis TaxID=1547922 RepID=UPI003AAF0E3C
MTTAPPADDWTVGLGPDMVYAQLLARDEFRIQHCRSCDSHLFYPRLACSCCGGIELDWVAPSGRGVVHAVSVVNRKADKGGPYNVVLVDLAEGPRLMSRVEGIAPEAIHIGMAVQARVARGDDGACVVFDAVNASTGAAT